MSTTKFKIIQIFQNSFMSMAELTSHLEDGWMVERCDTASNFIVYILSKGSG